MRWWTACVSHIYIRTIKASSCTLENVHRTVYPSKSARCDAVRSSKNASRTTRLTTSVAEMVGVNALDQSTAPAASGPHFPLRRTLGEYYAQVQHGRGPRSSRKIAQLAGTRLHWHSYAAPPLVLHVRVHRKDYTSELGVFPPWRLTLACSMLCQNVYYVHTRMTPLSKLRRSCDSSTGEALAFARALSSASIA